VLALHEIVLLDSRPLRYPLPWAQSPIAHFPAAPQRLRTSVESAGFTLRAWRDTTPAAREWWREAARGLRDDAPNCWPELLGPDAGTMLDNVVANLDEGRLGVMIAVFDRTSWHARDMKDVRPDGWRQTRHGKLRGRGRNAGVIKRLTVEP
jgi:hypothetical protein